MKRTTRARGCAYAMAVGIAASMASAQESEWRFTGGEAGGSRYSALDQINRSNVRNLQPVWT